MSASTLAAGAGSPPRPEFRRIALFDVVLPFLAIALLLHNNVAPVLAFGVAGLFPAGSVLIAWFRRGRFDVIGAGVLMGIASGLLLAVVTGDPRLGLLRAAPAFAVFGLASLASLPSSRPLMFYVARAFATGGDAAANAAWNARLAEPRFRGVMRRLTAVWGTGALAHAVLGFAIVFSLPASAAAIAEPVTGVAILSALLAYARSVQRRARRSAA